MNRIDSLKINRLYGLTALGAVIVGASLAAFGAKSPTTLAMWASAYLVLVVGVAQGWFGVALARLVKSSSQWLTVWVYGLFNTGNLAVIVSTMLKYNDHRQHLVLTTLGAVLVNIAMILLARQLWFSRSSLIKLLTYSIIVLLMTSSLLGLVLATLP